MNLKNLGKHCQLENIRPKQQFKQNQVIGSRRFLADIISLYSRFDQFGSEKCVPKNGNKNEVNPIDEMDQYITRSHN